MASSKLAGIALPAVKDMIIINKLFIIKLICFLRLTVDTGEDVSDESDLSQTEFFKLFLVAGNHSVGFVVQSVVETGDTGLTGGKTLSESVFELLC